MTSPLRFCLRCHRENKRSKVFSLGGHSTAMANADGEEFWDEDGVWHRHDVNVVTQMFQCSNLHRWQEKRRHRCPAPDCDWNRDVKSDQVIEST